MILVMTSDTHTCHRDLVIPPGDVFIHAGDFTHSGTMDELEDFNDWLGSLAFQHKLIVAGNHEFCLERQAQEARETLTCGTYLEDQGVTIDGVHFYGSPWQPKFMNWAFSLPRGQALKDKWNLIPEQVDVLITHTPPYGILDSVMGKPVGCEELRPVVEQLRPKVHVFGHIHNCAGQSQNETTSFVNASAFDKGYGIVHQPTVIEI
ncbi:MAG: metallophosphatase domain-containing protein [Planctomycetota bacterium]|nr:metallophosphatase domain-containing protein [Planctomycetota bacterium]